MAYRDLAEPTVPDSVVVRQIGPWRRGRDVLAMSRPRFWFLSVVALYVGFVLESHRILPQGDEIAALVHAGVIAGPLVWLAVLAANDAHDLDTDLVNPRKKDSPLVAGRVSVAGARRIGMAASALAVVLAAPLNGLFTADTATVVLLGWAYSAPPLRLKARAGADVAVNSVVAGGLGPLGGWVAVSGSTAGYPWPLGAVGVMAVAALYLPTTLVDRSADRQAGYRTTAVALGRRVTFELGFALWAGSAVLTLVLGLADTVVDPSLVPLHLVMTPILLALYRVLLKDRPSFWRIGLVAAAYLVPCAAFVVTYVELA
jgi:chlorophyll synthase